MVEIKVSAQTLPKKDKDTLIIPQIVSSYQSFCPGKSKLLVFFLFRSQGPGTEVSSTSAKSRKVIRDAFPLTFVSGINWVGEVMRIP